MTHATLTPRQQRFVQEYLKGFDANAAYRRAGYACGRKPFNAWATLNGPRVRAAIEAAQREAVREIVVDAARVIHGHAAIAFASIGDFVSVAADGTVNADIAAVDPDRRVALDVFDVTERRVRATRGGGRIRRLRIRLAPKLDALDALARHFGLFDGGRDAGASSTDLPPEPAPPLFAGVGPSAIRRARFVAEYLRCNDATRAYVRAGYRNTTGHTANASRLRADPEIRAAIDAGRRRLARRFEASVDRLIEEYARIAFATLDDFLAIDDDGATRLDLRRAQPAHWTALRELVVEQHIERTDGRAPFIRSAHLKLASKQHALDVLARYLGLFRKPDPLAGLVEDFRAFRERHDRERYGERRCLEGS